MAIFRRRPKPPSRRFFVDVPREITQGNAGFNVAGRITRREALQVPAVLRARNLICSTLATLPLKLHGPDRAMRPWRLFDQPDPDMPVSVTMAQTYEDLFFEGVAWWKIVEKDAQGWPAAIQFAPHMSVSPTAAPWTGLAGLVSPDLPIPENPDGVFIDGVFTPNNWVIRFDSPNPPLLVHAARAIRTCLLLDSTAARYADEPVGVGYFESTDDGVDPFEDEEDPNEAVQSFLDEWADARRRHAWGMIPTGLRLGSGVGFSPRDLQLADARQHAVLEIARASGIDPEDLGVSTTSRTYQNDFDRRKQFTDFTLGAYVAAMQDRLSMKDVSPRGSYARISFDAFLRSDIVTRLNAYKLGREVGVYDDQRIAELEDIPYATPAAAPTAAGAAMPDNVRELPYRGTEGMA